MLIKPGYYIVGGFHHPRLFHYYNGSQQWQVWIRDNSNNRLSFDNGTTGGVYSTELPPLNSWTYVTFVKQDNTYLIYYDSVCGLYRK